MAHASVKLDHPCSKLIKIFTGQLYYVIINLRFSEKLAMKIGTLSVGPMTGRSMKVVDMMGRRGINVLCVQKCGKARKPEKLEKGISCIIMAQSQKK